jgi:hypothetical protein
MGHVWDGSVEQCFILRQAGAPQTKDIVAA